MEPCFLNVCVTIYVVVSGDSEYECTHTTIRSLRIPYIYLVTIMIGDVILNLDEEFQKKPKVVYCKNKTGALK